MITIIITFDDNVIHCGKVYRSQQFHNVIDIADLHQHETVLLFLLIKNHGIQDTTCCEMNSFYKLQIPRESTEVVGQHMVRSHE